MMYVLWSSWTEFCAQMRPNKENGSGLEHPKPLYLN